MNKLAVCPDINAYHSLASGQLPPDTKEALLRHLEGCDSCVQKIQALPADDTLVAWIQQSKPIAGEPQEKQLAPLIQRLIQLRQTGAAPKARTFAFSCPGCGKALRVKEEAAGKKVKCPHCGQVAQTPAAERPEGAAETPPAAQETGVFTPADAGASAPITKAGLVSAADLNRSSEDTQFHTSSKDQKLCSFLAPAQAPDELGRLGPYRVLKVLGAGGMGVVFRAEDPQLQRLVALKAMLPEIAANESARQRFLREARAAAKLKHDHIVTIHQVGEDRGAPFLAMEFLEGEALEERIKRAAPGEGASPLPLTEILRIGREIAEGLEAAHEHGLIHRDIKPGNVWLEGKRGRVKILDFGLARSANEDVHLTQSGAIVGTPAYMPPEQARGEAVDGRCDLYSLGCVLYRLCTGQLPFKGDNTMSLLLALATEQPKSVRELNADVPPALADLIMRLLAKDPAQRPATAREVVEALDAIDTGEPVVVKVARAPVPPRRRRRLAVAVAGGALLLAVMLTVIVIHLGKPEEGTVTIETVDPDVELVFTSGGKDFKVHDKKTGKEIKLPLGTYQVKLNDGKDGLKLNANQFTLMSGGDRALVRVTWKAGDQPKSARANIPAPMQVAEPPPLAEWLKGRTVLTVSQDGKSQFKTIQAALDALKPHQVVKVLDRGPYRENLERSVVPEDCGLISEQQTVVTYTEWTKKFGNGRHGHLFGNMDGLRIHGFHFIIPAKPEGDYNYGIAFINPSGLVIENCCIQVMDKGAKAFTVNWFNHEPAKPVWLRDCLVEGRFTLSTAEKGRGTAVLERNFLDGPGNQCVYVNGSFRRFVVRHNILGENVEHSNLAFNAMKDIEALQISNNTALSTQPFVFSASPPPENVFIRNNLRTQPGLAVVVTESGAGPVRDKWQVSHNAYPRELSHGEFSYVKAMSFPRTPHDLLVKSQFLSSDRHASDYLRIPPDSPLAAGGAGGAWPSYIGALPPGPAPKDGDWFTRLRQRWGDVAPAVKPLSPPVQVPEPPPLAEWLKGRTILTVSQDGKSQFKTIQAALDALKPHQVVKVLDRGPYRERLSLKPVPADTGLVSEQQTVLELSEWVEIEKDVPVGHYFESTEGFRMHGFALIFPTNHKAGYCLDVANPNGFVLENCLVQLPEKGELMAATMFNWGSDADMKPAWVRDCMFRGRLIFASWKRSAIAVAERNYLDGPGSQALFIGGVFAKLVIRHNVLGGRVKVADIGINGMKEVDSLEVRNNTTTSTNPVMFGFVAPGKNVTIRNNLHSQPGLLILTEGAEKYLPAIIENWQVSHNAYPRQLREGLGWLGKQNIVPQAPGDVLAEPKFLSLDPAHPDYLRVAADSPLAKGGAGGDWPSYIGALLPGPAPKDGDWFTHLREKWRKDKPAAGK